MTQARISEAAKRLSVSCTVSKSNWPISWVSDVGTPLPSQAAVAVPTSMQRYLGDSEGVSNRTPVFKSPITLVN